MESPSTTNHFLPDLCRAQSVFLVVLVAQLLAIVLTLSSTTEPGWEVLGLYSLMIQWTALLSCAMLCGLRSRISHRPVWQIGLVAYGLILLATFFCSVTAVWLVEHHADFSKFGMLNEAQWLFVLKNLTISSIIGAVLLRYFYLQQEYRYRLAAESKARIEALHARIHPHFLFNTLNSIAALVRLSPEQAEQAVENLAGLMRAILNDIQFMVSWEHELKISRQYIELELLRLGDRLQIQFEVDSVPSDFPVPSLFLQPLIENAIIHGITHCPEGGLLKLKASISSGQLKIIITNPLAPAKTKERHGTGVGLGNVKNRLQLLYQDKARLRTEKSQGQFQVEIELPDLRLVDKQS